MTTEGDSPGRGGFPAGARQTAVPSLFFSDVLPVIGDEAELIVTLYAFYVLGRKRSTSRYFVEAELNSEGPLLRALDRLPGGATVALERGLLAAVQRGTLMRATGSRDGRRFVVYALHAPGGEALLQRLSAAITRPAGDDADADVAAHTPLQNIFVLYEENIGVISPLLADQLREAESIYPWPWIEAAFREAVAQNRRSWRYIERILQRWRTEGPDLEAIRRSVEGQRTSLAGRYWRLVRH